MRERADEYVNFRDASLEIEDTERNRRIRLGIESISERNVLCSRCNTDRARL